MLARLILLSFCLISHGSSGLIENPTREERIGTKLEGVSSDNKQSLRALGPSEVGPSQVEQRPLMRHCIKSIDQLTPEQRSDAHKSWVKNQDTLKLFYQHLQELSALDSQIQSRRELLDAKVLRFYGRVTDAMKVLRQLKKRIGFLNEVKLLELGNIDLPNSYRKLMELVFSKDDVNPDLDTLPRAIVQDISKKIWKNLGGSIVLDLKNLMHHKHSLFLYSRHYASDYDILLWWKYALTTIDLLVVIDFVEQDTVREFFHDPNIVEQILHYTTLRHGYDARSPYTDIIGGSPHFPQRWYWPFWHDCFKVLSNEEENLLRGHFLLQSRYKDLFNYDDIELPKWSYFILGSFLPSKYLQQLQSSSKSLTSEIQDMINRDVERIIEVLTTSCKDPQSYIRPSQRLVFFWLHDILDLIETCISPGIIEKTLVEHPGAPWYQTYRELWKLMSQKHYSHWNADQYFNYVKYQSPKDWSTSSLYKSTFDAHLNQSIQIHSEFTNEVERLRAKLQERPDQLEYIESLLEMEKSIGGYVKIEQEWSAEFKL